jgi:hypothetical protein
VALPPLLAIYGMPHPLDGLFSALPIQGAEGALLSGSAPLGAPAALPFLTTDDLLHVLHVLRC